MDELLTRADILAAHAVPAGDTPYYWRGATDQDEEPAIL
jgi:hypothetical protein